MLNNTYNNIKTNKGVMVSVLIGIFIVMVLIFFINNEQQPIPKKTLPIALEIEREDKVVGIVKAYQIPTSDLGPEYYEQDIKDLPSIKDSEVIFDLDGIDGDIGHEYFTEQIEEYGDLAKRFLPNDVITYKKEFDVDGDGVDETIVGICGLWG